MQLSQITIAGLLYTAAGVSAKCYSGGVSGAKGAGLTEANILWTASGMLKGKYLPGESREQCAMDTFRNKWRFFLKVSKKPHLGTYRQNRITNALLLKNNDKKKTMSVDHNQVMTWLTGEATKCEYGGHNDQGSWGWE